MSDVDDEVYAEQWNGEEECPRCGGWFPQTSIENYRPVQGSAEHDWDEVHICQLCGLELARASGG